MKIIFIKSNLFIKQVIIVLFLVLGFSTVSVFGQRDLITTQAGEKIRCRILDETPNRFIYAYLSPSGKILRNEIFKNLVSEFKYSHFSSDIVIPKGQKMPKGLGDQQAENTASPSRVEPSKKEPESRKVSKKDKELADKINRGEEVKEEKTSKKNEKDKQAENNKKEVEKSQVTKNEKPDESSSKRNTPRDMGERSDEKKVEEKPSNEQVKQEDKKSEKLDKKESSSNKTTENTAKPKKVEQEEEETKGTAPLAEKTEANDYKNHLKFRVGGKFGFGQLLEKTTETTLTEYGLYQEKLKRGYTWGADAAYFFGDSFGAGVMFNNFTSRNTASDAIKFKNIFTEKEETGTLSNSRSTKFVGPVFYFRKNIDFKTMVILGLAPGAYFHTDKGTYGETKYTSKGMDYGAAATLGIDFLLGNDIIGRDIILSLEAGYNYGKMRALNYGDGNGAKVLPTPMDMSRVDITVGLRFTRYPKYFRLTSY